MLQAVKLLCKPRARFHFGKVAPDNNTSLNGTSEWLHSDTLFSAWANIIGELYDAPKAQSLLAHFEQEDIQLSSAFYVIEYDGQHIWLLPKPAHLGLEVQSDFKDFNRVKLISKGVWESGLPFNQWKENGFLFIQNGYAVVRPDELPADNARSTRLFTESDTPRVRIHGVDQQDAFFYLTYISIADNSDVLPGSAVHFYFLLNVREAFKQTEAYKEIMTALNMLPLQGIGGERSAGCGHIQGLQTLPFELRLQTTPNGVASVALTAPADLKKFKAYQVITRGGRHYLGSDGNRLDFIRMLHEGAYADTLQQGNITEIGRLNNIPFLRYGKPFWLPVGNKPQQV